MMSPWTNLSEADRAAFRAASAFLNKRLEERATVRWALGLAPNEVIKRLAVSELIDSPHGGAIKEPWRTAWRMIEESWNNPISENRASTAPYHLRQRIKTGDRSGSLIAAIIDLVCAKLKLEPRGSESQAPNRARSPRSISDLLSTQISSSVSVIDPDELGINDLDDVAFLGALANALDASVVSAIDMASRLGWKGERSFWMLGGLNRVYFVPAPDRPPGEDEPDEFHHGIAPSTKLLHAAIARLAQLRDLRANEFVRRWEATHSSIHRRLWAALSRDPKLVPPSNVSALLLALNDRMFWDLHAYPEIAELRAIRFGEFEETAKEALLSRIRKRPPRSQWPKRAERAQVESARTYWAVRELRRIEIAGATLPGPHKNWLARRIGRFPELAQMSRIDTGFIGSSQAYFVPPNPDNRFDFLHGEERLKELELALGSPRRGWDDDPAERAADWIGAEANARKVLVDLEGVTQAGGAFARVWERFGWVHKPKDPEAQPTSDGSSRDTRAEAERVLALLAALPEATAAEAINGISHWLSITEKQLATIDLAPRVWLRFWPSAVNATNSEESSQHPIDLGVVARSTKDEPMDLDTLNTPAGRFVGIFLAWCPEIRDSDRPFDINHTLRAMRDVIISARGRAGLVAKYRLIESLSYFLRADPDWTQQYLFPPLLGETPEALTLWRAASRGRLSPSLMSFLGDAMITRAIDARISRETRRALVFRLIVECLYALRETREPVVPHSRIQQMIRSLDDEVRAHGAEALHRFVSELSARDGSDPAASPEELFRQAASPFLDRVWPQERSLATPGISRALADLPASCGEAFPQAVNAIERFLVPFDCWSMLDYGLFGETDGRAKLTNINTSDKAEAFLRLLDRTIGTTETAVIPHDLSDALSQIRQVAPDLVSTLPFRRLATAARRF